MHAYCSCIFIFRNHFTQMCLAALKTGRNNSRMLAAIFLLEVQSLTALHYSQVHILISCENEAACMFLTQQLLLDATKRKKSTQWRSSFDFPRKLFGLKKNLSVVEKPQSILAGNSNLFYLFFAEIKSSCAIQFVSLSKKQI